MGAEQHRAALAAQLLQLLLEQVACLGVQAHKGFVQNQQLGLAHQGRDQGKFLLHAVGVAGNGAAQSAGHLEHIPVLGDALGAQVGGDVVEIGHKVQKPDAGEELV